MNHRTAPSPQCCTVPTVEQQGSEAAGNHTCTAAPVSCCVGSSQPSKDEVKECSVPSLKTPSAKQGQVTEVCSRAGAFDVLYR